MWKFIIKFVEHKHVGRKLQRTAVINVLHFSILAVIDKCPCDVYSIIYAFSSRWFMRSPCWRRGDNPSARDPSPSCSVLRSCLWSRRFSFATSQCAIGRKLTVLRYCAPITRRQLRGWRAVLSERHPKTGIQRRQGGDAVHGCPTSNWSSRSAGVFAGLATLASEISRPHWRRRGMAD